MTIEEKAKRYDEATKKAKKELDVCGSQDCDAARQIFRFFPELQESERIRGAIIDHLKDNNLTEWAAWLEKQCNTNETIDRDKFAQGILRGAAINLITWIDYNAAEGNMCLSNVQCKEIENALVRGDWNKIYAYMKKKLERQDEQKHIFDFNANNWYVSKVDGKIHNIYNSGVEPRFKVEDWVVWQDKCYKVNYNGCRYELIDQNGLSTSLEHGTIDGSAHLWDISDAKDGDVLAFSNDTIVIFKDLYNSSSFHSYCHIEDGEFGISEDDMPDWWEGKGFHPATKEQCDLLFQKMREAGYEWDTEKKELKRIEQKPSEWSEEDESISNDI